MVILHKYIRMHQITKIIIYLLHITGIVKYTVQILFFAVGTYWILKGQFVSMEAVWLHIFFFKFKSNLFLVS